MTIFQDSNTYRGENDMSFLSLTPKIYPQNATIQHWQLRDMLSCPFKRGELFVVNVNTVQQFFTDSKLTLYPLKDLSFQPASMTAAHDYVAAGGQRSQLVIRHLPTNWFGQTTVGGSINNSLEISKHLNDTRILICNNDETIKIHALPSLSRVACLKLPTSVNSTAVSPDGRRMIAVGDTNQVFMHDISAASGYKLTSTLTTTQDAAFSCSWNASSDKFAVSCQDGWVCVWDIRSSHKLACLPAFQNNREKKACRKVIFSPSGSIDLLLYSEHMSYINVVDARTFDAKQAIRVAPEMEDRNISGLTFSPDSRAVYVSLDNQLLEYEVDSLLRRTFPTGSIC